MQNIISANNESSLFCFSNKFFKYFIVGIINYILQNTRMDLEEIPNLHSTQRRTTNSDDKQQTTNPNTCISLNKYLEQLVWIFIPRSEVLQFHLYVVMLMPI